MGEIDDPEGSTREARAESWVTLDQELAAAATECDEGVQPEGLDKPRASDASIVVVDDSAAPSPEIQGATEWDVGERIETVDDHATLNSNRGNFCVRETGFVNGQVIVTVLPKFTRWTWITPVWFPPDLVPHELIVPELSLTVEEYVHTLEQLSSDYRFKEYTMLYKRIIPVWIFIAVLISVIILPTAMSSYIRNRICYGEMGGLIGCLVGWILVNMFVIALCLYTKMKLNRRLEQCLTRVNRALIKHNLILGVKDRGTSCHAMRLVFIYFAPADCIKALDEDQISEPLERERQVNPRYVEINIQGQQNGVLPPLPGTGIDIFLEFVPSWAHDYLDRKLDWTCGDRPDENPSRPLHLTSAVCPCQYAKDQKKANQNNWEIWYSCCAMPTYYGCRKDTKMYRVTIR